MNSLDLIRTSLLKKYDMDEEVKADVADFINEALAANIIIKTWKNRKQAAKKKTIFTLKIYYQF